MNARVRLRKASLTAHVTFSVGWLGAVAAFLALAMYGLWGDDPTRAQGAYLAMDLVAWSVLLPLGLAAGASGLVQGFVSPWGILRHYWVIAKLAITAVATALLLLHLQVVDHVADAAAHGALEGVGQERVQLVANAAMAVVALVAVVLLSVFKPRGMTRRGRRRQAQTQAH